MSTRTRLTISYAVVLLGTTIAFALALLFARRTGATQRIAQQSSVVADGVLDAIKNDQLGGRHFTAVDSTRDLNGVIRPVIRPTKEIAELLDRKPGYFLVMDSQDKLLYSSSAVRLLSVEDQQSLMDVALRLRPTEAAIVPLADTVLDSKLLLVARRDAAVGPNISRVVAGMPTTVADIAPALLFGTMIALLPVILLLSLAFAYWIAGRAFHPVDQIINEVEAITDGRSLHRRLPVDHSNDELARLASTLNAMIARLETSFSALRRFTADASHELRTPLTVLRADVERAMHPRTTRGERMVALEEALHETARMADLVDSLLTLARADEGRFDLHRSRIHLEPIAREVYETAVILGEESGLTVDLPAVEDAVVLGERNRLRHLFLNLVTNAIKYTPRGGRVEISLQRRAHDEVSFTVRDTGIGIAASDLPHVFERFWRADRVRSRRVAGPDGLSAVDRGGGFGLGLSIAQWIVQAHGGTLTVQSRLGRGSIFTVILPTADESASENEVHVGVATGDDVDASRAGREDVVAQVDSNSDFTDS